MNRNKIGQFAPKDYSHLYGYRKWSDICPEDTTPVKKVAFKPTAAKKVVKTTKQVKKTQKSIYKYPVARKMAICAMVTVLFVGMAAEANNDLNDAVFCPKWVNTSATPSDPNWARCKKYIPITGREDNIIK